ncbi:phosphoribosyltransferase [Candidatus Uhrbacteria bacterium]|nr:phosphoribosyltransferase [Candidatus Uhrbacteria bacterium]
MWKDRSEAAQELVTRLKQLALPFDIVLALPRGGVILGAIIARAFKKPLDLLIPRKIGAPSNEEYAIGAVTEEGIAVWNEEEKASVDPSWLEHMVAKQRAEATRRRLTYLGSAHRRDLRGKSILIVDDGIATGLTMMAAIAEARQLQAGKILLAIPVAPPDTLERIRPDVEGVAVLSAPASFGAVGAFYENFPQVTDAEVISLLKEFL